MTTYKYFSNNICFYNLTIAPETCMQNETWFDFEERAQIPDVTDN